MPENDQYLQHTRRYTGQKLVKKTSGQHKELNRTTVPSDEKLELLNNMFSCRLDRHRNYLLSNTARGVVFRKPRKMLTKVKSVTRMKLQMGLMTSVIESCRKTNLR